MSVRRAAPGVVATLLVAVAGLGGVVIASMLARAQPAPGGLRGTEDAGLPLSCDVLDGGPGAAPPGLPLLPDVPMRAVAREPNRAIARGRDIDVTVADIAAILNARPPMLRRGFASTEQLDMLGADVIQERVLAAEARRQGLDRDPTLRREIDGVLARAVVERAVTAADARPVTEAEIREYYTAHADDFTRPERVRISVIVLEDEPSAHRALEQARAADPRRFRGLVRRLSRDRRSRNRNGDAGWVDRIGSGWDPAVVETAFTISQLGRVADTVAHTADDLYYVIRLDDRHPPELIELDALRITIASRIRAERRAAATERLARELARDAGLWSMPASRFITLSPDPDVPDAGPSR